MPSLNVAYTVLYVWWEVAIQKLWNPEDVFFSSCTTHHDRYDVGSAQKAMELAVIQEEPADADPEDGGMEEEVEDFDSSLLHEYAVLTEDDLKQALYGDKPDGAVGCSCGDVKSDWCQFAAFHETIGIKNKQVISRISKRQAEEKQIDVHPETVCPLFDEPSPVCSPHNGNVVDGPQEVLKVLGEYDQDSAYNSLKSNDSALLNVETTSFGSASPSLSERTNESITRSLMGSEKGSVFNLDHIINVPSKLPLELQGIDFNTVVGRKVFIKAIHQKYMNIYYVLSQQRLCGDFIGNQSVATFVMILNSLEVRQSGLKGKYFEQHSLDQEMSFTDIAAMARDNKLSAEVTQVFKKSSLANFRKAVKLSCKSSNILLLCCYHVDNTCEQFSFIGGYFKDKDTVLLLTPSKSKFVARWIPMLLMWRILLNETSKTENRNVSSGASTNDTPFRNTGGYMLLQRNETNPRIAVRISKNTLLCLEAPACANKRNVVELMSNWSCWLALPATDATDDVIFQAINFVVNNLNADKYTSQFTPPLTADEQRCVSVKLNSFSDMISRTKVYTAVKNQIESLSTDSLKRLEMFSDWAMSMTYPSNLVRGCADRKMKITLRRKKQPPSNNASLVYKHNLMFAICLIFWPYENDGRSTGSGRGTNRGSLAQAVYSDLMLLPYETRLRVQKQTRFIVNIMNTFITPTSTTSVGKSS